MSMRRFTLFMLTLLFSFSSPASGDILDDYMMLILPSTVHTGAIDTDVFVGGDYTLLAWNDLGMHCVDGNDYSVFSILPPYNNLHAQLKHKNGGRITSGVTLTYKAQAGENSVFNTTSITDRYGNPKTNFWQYVHPLFGASPAPDTGLTGIKMQTKHPQQMHFSAAAQLWLAEGLPITPIDDDGTTNYYPRVRVAARDLHGTLLAEAITVLPVSDEMDCRTCHASSSGYREAEPSAGWVNDPDALKDYKRNILRKHDDNFPTAVSDHLAALQLKGYDYNASGLEATQTLGTPILCAACHRSNALPGTGVEGISALTRALHGSHATAKDPQTHETLDAAANRNACYRCHPGEATQCLRGAMGDAQNEDGTAAMDCQSCHGSMGQMGSAEREGWLDEPNCQACHQEGQRHLSVFTSGGTLRAAVDNRFATNPDTPAAGYSLYRLSTGHGDLQCEACHGATHAIYPSHEAGDNLLSERLQGHAGTVAECTACHTAMPQTGDGGPHGMHAVSQAWVDGHGSFAEHNLPTCAACHGADFNGSILSVAWTARAWSYEEGTVAYTAGRQVGCYDCHNGPNDD